MHNMEAAMQAFAQAEAADNAAGADAAAAAAQQTAVVASAPTHSPAKGQLVEALKKSIQV